MNPVILHVDMNNFFASVSCRSHPELRDKPVAICGDIEKRHGIILAKNNIAKARGVKTGSTIGEAVFFCPDLCMLPPENSLYMQVSAQARQIYYDYTSQIESFGIDECWLDVTGSQRLFGDGVTIADEIRRRIRDELGITASVGGTNLLFATEEGLVIGCEICEDLWAAITPGTYHALNGANLLVNLSASNESAGKREYRKMLVTSASAKLLCGYVYASAGEGESTQDVVFGGHHLIAENGTILKEAQSFINETI